MSGQPRACRESKRNQNQLQHPQPQQSNMPPDIIPEDEDYASEEDSDFAPDVAQAQAEDEESDDESEAEVEIKKSAKRKRGQDEEAEDAGFENSGDEAIIERGLKKQKKKGKKGKDVEEEDEGGEGGLIKTRSMRAQEYEPPRRTRLALMLMSSHRKEEKKKPLADTTAATVDVDALWASMISGKTRPPPPEPAIESSTAINNSGFLSPTSSRNLIAQNGRKDSRSPSTLSDGPDSMIMIKRTYNFAGKVHTEQKLVSRNSAEAKLWLASQNGAESEPQTEEASSPFAKPKRPTKRARKSVFEPITEIPKRTDLYFGPRKESGVALLDIGKDAKKMNTVDKSAMDWARFVDKEGIADELDAAGKSKGAYKTRQEFLARVESKKIEDERRARGLPV